MRWQVVTPPCYRHRRTTRGASGLKTTPLSARSSRLRWRPVVEPPRTIRDIAIALAEGLATPEWTSPPVIVGIAGIDDDGFDLRVHPLVVEGETEAMHPADLLPLLDIPDDWLAVGAVAYGWVAPLDDAKPPVRPSGHPDAEPARIVSIIDRAGNETAAIQRVTGRQHVIEVGADNAYDSRETGA